MRHKGNIDVEHLLMRNRWLIEFICKQASYGDPVVCADMIRECYTTIWRHKATLPSGAGLLAERSWVFWQCRSTVSHHRRRNRQWWVPFDERLAETIADTDDSETRELIEDLASDLNERERMLLDLILEGFNNNEIATMTSLAPNIILNLRRSMLRHMRQTYDNINKKTIDQQ